MACRCGDFGNGGASFLVLEMSGYTANLKGLKPPLGFRFLRIGEYIPISKAKVLAAGMTWTSVKALRETFGTWYAPRVSKWHNPFAVPLKGAAKPEPEVSYAHQKSPKGIRFRQYAKDPLPPWAVDIRSEKP